MPYYISDQQNDCQGWAALVADSPNAEPRIIGCHQNKQDAIDQMIAASISDNIEPAGDWATRSITLETEQELDPTPAVAAIEAAKEMLKKVIEDVASELLLAEPISESETKIEIEDDQPSGMMEMDLRNAPTVEHRWVISKTSEQRKQIAYTNLELRALDNSEDGWTVSGYASVFDSPSEPLPWNEYVKRGAFTKTIKDGADVRLLIDHTGVPLARTKSGTLSLREDNKGLFMEARLDPNNPDAVKMRSALMRGDVSQMSFAFETIKDGWNADRTVRELREVRLHDVSIVTYPAYEETSAEIRNNNTNETVIATVAPTSLRKAQIALAKARAVN